MNMKNNITWTPIRTIRPPEGVRVKTKIDNEKGVRNETDLIFKSNLWWFPDMSMYVYYTPTHWRLAE